MFAMSAVVDSPVVVTASFSSLELREEGSNSQGCGGNGFERHGFVMTSATWLASLLQLEPLGPHSRPTGVKWRLSNTETVFHVIFENAKPQPMATTLQPIETTPQPIATTPQPIATTPQPIATTPQSIATTPQPIATTPQPLVTTPDSGLCVVEAEISSVHLLQHVYSSLVTQLHSLSQWRCEVQSVTSDGGGRERVREEGGREVVSMESLLLPLSCVVLLTVKGETPSSATASPLSPYQPCVGQSLVSVYTPFAAYCPEIFHSTMTTGCVCKLIGQNGCVFLTDACNLPGSEGAGLRRNISTGVVAMVMTPLFTERGHPTGLSLATTLSSLPPPHSHPYNSLPLPHSHLASGVCQLVVAVATSSTWGSGVLISSNRVLTCSHVVKSKLGSISVYLPWSHSTHLSGSVLEWNQDMDIAIIGLRQSIVESPILELLRDQFTHQRSWQHQRARDYQGEQAVAIGYEAPPQTGCGLACPLVTQGVVCKVVSDHWDGEGVMVVTSAVVLPGMSGGVIASAEDGRLLGMIVSISEDMTSGYTYPTVNYSLSLPWLLPPLRQYVLTGDSHGLRQLIAENRERVKQLWSLSSHVMLPPSKL